jgi:glutamate-1-semialdehyde 2,1-aminomutase
MSTLNCPEEVELAELLVEIHPWAEMARFARAGGEAMAVAARIARAATGRDQIAFCGYHGWHDWYLSANLAEDHALDGHLLPGLQPAGVPAGLTGTMLPFHYNNIDELRALVASHGTALAAIVMEPARDQGPASGFLSEIRQIASTTGAVLIFDEVTSGLRLTSGGAHLVYGVDPDIAVFAKAIGNGYPMAAIIGRRAVMEAAQSSFISSTSWTERIGPTAALATIRKHRRLAVASHLIRVGESVQRAWRVAGREVGLRVSVSGIAPLGHLSFDYSNGDALMTLFTQEMLDRGFLASGAFYASYAHRPEHLSAYESALRDVFGVVAEALKADDVMRRLRGPVKHSSFQRLT